MKEGGAAEPGLGLAGAGAGSEGGADAEAELVVEDGRVEWDLVMRCKARKRAPLKLSVSDFSGQPVFMLLHHFFLSRYGAYLVLFNMEWLAMGAEEWKQTESMETLRSWLAAIQAHTSTDGDGARVAILLVGTHKDRCADAAEHARISARLAHTFSTHPLWPTLHLFHNPGAASFPRQTPPRSRV